MEINTSSFQFQVSTQHLRSPIKILTIEKKKILLHFIFPQYLKCEKPNIQQQETMPCAFSTTLMDLHIILQPIVNFETCKFLLHL
jgi:hypothetical protein